MNKTVKIIICIVVLVWLFAMGLVTGTFIARRSYMKKGSAGQQEQTQSSSESTGISIDIVTDVPTSSQRETEEFTFEFPSDYNSFSTYKYESVN